MNHVIGTSIPMIAKMAHILKWFEMYGKTEN